MKSSMHIASVPYETIVLASKGDIGAIAFVLNHYGSYIAALSARTLGDENCLPRVYFDDEMHRRLETKLIARILYFDVERNIKPNPHIQKEDRHV